MLTSGLQISRAIFAVSLACPLPDGRGSVHTRNRARQQADRRTQLDTTGLLVIESSL